MVSIVIFVVVGLYLAVTIFNAVYTLRGQSGGIFNRFLFSVLWPFVLYRYLKLRIQFKRHEDEETGNRFCYPMVMYHLQDKETGLFLCDSFDEVEMAEYGDPTMTGFLFEDDIEQFAPTGMEEKVEVRVSVNGRLIERMDGVEFEQDDYQVNNGC